MMSYTPGSWEADSKKLVIRRGQGSKMGFAREAREDCYIVETANGGHRHIAFVRNRIDARAIAAAPDAVESFRKLIMHCTNYAGYLKTLGAEFAEMRDRVQGEIDEASAILRRIDGEEKTE